MATRILLLAGPALAQTSISQQAPAADGLHLYGVSLSSGYFSGNSVSIPGIPLLYGSYDTESLTGMVSASFGWSKSTPMSATSIVYSPAYVRGFHFQNFHSLNHSLAMNANRTLGMKWRMSGWLTAIVSDFRELLFAPSAYGTITGTTSTFDEFAGGVLTGRTDNQALAAALSSPKAISAPQDAYIYGTREFSSVALLSFSYQRSQRSTFSIGLGAVRTQSLGEVSQTGTRPYYVPQTTSGNVSLGWSYSTSSRTNIGVSVSSGRVFSRYLDAYATQTNFSVGHTMSRRWFVQASGGAGYITPVHQKVAIARNVQYLFSGGLGFKTYTHTFLGSYSRTITDTYGLGANATDSSSASWSWRKPGSSFSSYALFGYMRLIGPGFPSVGSWMESGGATRALGEHFALSAAYSHVSLPAGIPMLGDNRSQHGAMLTLSWSPLIAHQ